MNQTNRPVIKRYRGASFVRRNKLEPEEVWKTFVQNLKKVELDENHICDIEPAQITKILNEEEISNPLERMIIVEKLKELKERKQGKKKDF